MSNSLRYVRPSSIITGWDFSTGSVKCIAFDLGGKVVAEERLPTDLWTEGGTSELNLMQLEGQARASFRGIADKLRDLDRLGDWVAGGISATHHTAGRIDSKNNQVRRAICWNDQSLAEFHERGLRRLGGQDRAREHIGGPWAIRYSLSHLVKDEVRLSKSDWKRTRWITCHGPLAAGYLTGRFDSISISSAASTGLLDLRTGTWCKAMLDALENLEYRELAWNSLPSVVDSKKPIGPISKTLAIETGLPEGVQPLIFPTIDDQAAGLIGGGAVEPGQVAIILGNSAVVNSSSSTLPTTNDLDAMRLNSGPYLWMRCYSNGAQFLDRIVGPNPDWQKIEGEARQIAPGSQSYSVFPFVLSEPSIGVVQPRFEWLPNEPTSMGIKLRASFEALAYLIALGVDQHVAAGQSVSKISVSGGIARSDLMCEILASVLGRPLERLASEEGPALGAAVEALGNCESYIRHQHHDPEPFTVADAVSCMVNYRQTVHPRKDWQATYQLELKRFRERIGQ